MIAVGYRINSLKATHFRIWATNTLREFLVKGFVLNDAQLKQGRAFGQDYFDELLERIREIRASERRAYQKIAFRRDAGFPPVGEARQDTRPLGNPSWEVFLRGFPRSGGLG